MCIATRLGQIQKGKKCFQQNCSVNHHGHISPWTELYPSRGAKNASPEQTTVVFWWFLYHLHDLKTQHGINQTNKKSWSKPPHAIPLHAWIAYKTMLNLSLCMHELPMAGQSNHPEKLQQQTSLAKLYCLTNLDFPEVRRFPFLSYILLWGRVFGRYSLARYTLED